MPGVGGIVTSRRDHSLTTPFFFLPRGFSHSEQRADTAHDSPTRGTSRCAFAIGMQQCVREYVAELIPRLLPACRRLRWQTFVWKRIFLSRFCERNENAREFTFWPALTDFHNIFLRIHTQFAPKIHFFRSEKLNWPSTLRCSYRYQSSHDITLTFLSLLINLIEYTNFRIIQNCRVQTVTNFNSVDLSSV